MAKALELYELEALKDIEKLLSKQLSQAHTNYEALKSANNTAMDLCSVSYDGVEYSTYDEIQEAYGCGAITQKRFDMLVSELMDKRREVSLDFKIKKAEKKLEYLTKLHKDIYNTIHWEEV